MSCNCKKHTTLSDVPDPPSVAERIYQRTKKASWVYELPRRGGTLTMAGVDDPDTLRRKFVEGQAEVDLTPIEAENDFGVTDSVEYVDSPTDFADRLKQQLANRPKGK